MANGKLRDTAEIDGLKFTTEQMDPLELYPMVPSMLEIVAGLIPYVSGLGGGLTKEAIEKLFAKADGVKDLGPILKELGAALGKKENARLPEELLRRTCVLLPVERKSRDDDEDETEDDDEPQTKKQSMATPKEINAVFRGRFWTMIKVMWWSMGVNFGGFLSGSSDESPSKE
jgi:hypothetical protein